MGRGQGGGGGRGSPPLSARTLNQGKRADLVVDGGRGPCAPRVGFGLFFGFCLGSGVRLGCAFPRAGRSVCDGWCVARVGPCGLEV